MSSPLDRLTEALRASREYQALAAGAPSAGRLPVPAAAWVLELLAREHARRLLVVVPHESDALAWVEAARLFGGDSLNLRVHHLGAFRNFPVGIKAQLLRFGFGVGRNRVNQFVFVVFALRHTGIPIA